MEIKICGFRERVALGSIDTLARDRLPLHILPAWESRGKVGLFQTSLSIQCRTHIITNAAIVGVSLPRVGLCLHNCASGAAPLFVVT